MDSEMEILVGSREEAGLPEAVLVHLVVLEPAPTHTHSGFGFQVKGLETFSNCSLFTRKRAHPIRDAMHLVVLELAFTHLD